MKRAIRSAIVIPLAAATILVSQNCATVDQMASVIAALQRLQFRIRDVSDFRLAGIAIGSKTALSQFSAADALGLVGAFTSRRLPADFVLNLEAVNPNTGAGGTSRTVGTLSSLECRLLIDGRPTITGNIDRPVEVPGTGQATMFPIRLSLDLLQFFGEKRDQDLINLALAIGGASRSSSRVALDAQPVVTTPLGDIAYPGRITIVDKEFR